MHESMPVSPDHEQLRASLLAEHGAAQIEEFGLKLSLDDFTKMADVLCPVPASQRSAEANLEFLANRLVKNNVQLDEKYMSFVTERPKVVSSKLKSEVAKPASEISKKMEPSAKPIIPNATAIERPTIVAEAPAKQVRSEVVPKVVRQKAVAEVVVLIQPPLAVELAAKPVELFANLKVTPVAEILQSEAVVEQIDFSEAAVPETPSLLSTEASEPIDNLYVSEVEVQTIMPESVVLENSETIDEPLDDEPQTILNTLVMPLPAPEASPPALAGLMEDNAEQLAANPEVEVEAAQLPITQTTEFIAQVLPIAVEPAREVLLTMTPEAAVEVAARVELLVVVADRLHELVLADNTNGDEAQQIEAFLKRDYEQLLVAVGIEPTPQILADFITYIYSDAYQLKTFPTELENLELEQGEQGTHEKKLFDEQSVFKKAHLASTGLSQSIGSKIGQMVVTYLAA